MIFITLGTQDKSFERLLNAVQEQIDKKIIKEKVIVQAGYTKFISKDMEIYDLLTMEKFDNYIKKCDILITHGGVGSILKGLKNNKKVIAAARLKEYKEHTNDHQLQIIESFSKKGYLINLSDFNNLGKIITKINSFKPQEFISNNVNFVNKLSDYIK